jgi:hypothetical protein
MIEAQRREPDTNKRIGIYKDFQRYMAKNFLRVPAEGKAGAWNFQWPWLHNINHRPFRQWLDASMPNRNG